MKLLHLFESQYGPAKMIEIAEAYLAGFSDWPIEQPLARYAENMSSQPAIMQGRTTADRESVGGTKVIQDALKRQPSWEKVPDRARSVFASTEYGAGSFANMASQSKSYSGFYIIPANGTWCAMIEDDFNSQPILDKPAPQIFSGRIAYDLMSHVSRLPEEHQRNLPELTNIWNIKEVLETLIQYGEPEAIHFVETKMRPFSEFVKAVSNDLIMPGGMGIKMFTPANYRKPKRPHEVWFTGEYLQIPHGRYEEFVKTVNSM